MQSCLIWIPIFVTQKKEKEKGVQKWNQNIYFSQSTRGRYPLNSGWSQHNSCRDQVQKNTKELETESSHEKVDLSPPANHPPPIAFCTNQTYVTPFNISTKKQQFSLNNQKTHYLHKYKKKFMKYQC